MSTKCPVLLSVMLVTAPALSMGEIPASAEWSAALGAKADSMNTRENGEIRQLKADELNEVTGAGVQIVRPPVGPASPSPSPTSGGTGGGGGLGDGGSGGGGGGGTVDYTGDPYAIHHLF